MKKAKTRLFHPTGSAAARRCPNCLSAICRTERFESSPYRTPFQCPVGINCGAKRNEGIDEKSKDSLFSPYGQRRGAPLSKLLERNLSNRALRIKSLPDAIPMPGGHWNGVP